MIKNIDKARETQVLVKRQWIESKIMVVEEVDVATIVKELNFIKKAKTIKEHSPSPTMKSQRTKEAHNKNISIFDDNLELGSIRSLKPLQSSQASLPPHKKKN